MKICDIIRLCEKSHSKKDNDHHANLVLFGWGGGRISIVALIGVTLVRYYGIKENDAHAIQTGNNLFRLLVISFVVAWHGLNGGMKTEILEYNETLCPFYSKKKLFKECIALF